jgi:bifunctional DNA-binding transcriptional regulator/antitoxin component of YhaV-PrlF toxin-antitoxin module
VKGTARSGSVWFTTKGQVVMPVWLRRQFHIEDGTRAVVSATPDGILLKPVTAALIKRGRGIVKRKPGDPPISEWWAEHKKQEKELEGRHAQSHSSATPAVFRRTSCCNSLPLKKRRWSQIVTTSGS